MPGNVYLRETAFSKWLDRELDRRQLSHGDLARGIGVRPQTTHPWFRKGVIPSPAMCRRIASFLGLSENEVLIQAGHLENNAARAEPVLPAWLTDLLVQLDEIDWKTLRVIGEELLRQRQEREWNAGPHNGQSRVETLLLERLDRPRPGK